MASTSTFFFFFLLLCAAVSTQPRRFSNISPGSSLTPATNSSWLSPSGLYAFGFFLQGHANGYAVGIYVAGIPEKTVVWTANRDNNPTVPDNATLQLTLDGRLLVQLREGQDIKFIVDSFVAIASASMLDNGNFVLYGSNSSIIWQSFDQPTNTLLPGQLLAAGQGLFSSASETDYRRGIFMLQMQTDGNLVQYPVNVPYTYMYAYYSTGTDGQGNNISLHLENDGQLYLFNGSSILKNITAGGYPTRGTIYLARLDVDGIFNLYSRSLDNKGNWTIRWSSIVDKCGPKGLCGLNSFCILMDDVANCECIPGFHFVQPGNWTAGCTRNFTVEGCGNIDQRVTYDIKRLQNTLWEDNPYSSSDTATVEECIQACRDDCNCEAAFFKDRSCKMQRLPLRFGRRSLSDSNTALVKVTAPVYTPGKVGTLDNSSKEIKKGYRLDILIIGISLIVVGALFMAISFISFHRKHEAYKNITYCGEPKLVEDVALQAFNYTDLALATNNFKEELGKGSSGTVYKGFLQSGQKAVAVKKLEKGFADGEREFHTEMKTIGRMYHRNLVRLLGYCLDGSNMLLVFEFMSNGSLADVLFKPDKQPSWEERINIGRDVARGILYLHEECETQIIHCDIKPQNILMDEHGHAKISDFGLAKLLQRDQTNTFTWIRGTKGYVAPEWHQKQPVTVKADVYSFGIVLLEIICCRRSIDWSLSEDEAVLEEWVYNCYEAGELGNLVGSEIVDKRKLERTVKIALWCIQYEPSLRPSMKKVLLMLEGTIDIPVPPNPTSFLSAT